jgi:hypothetical protein
MKLTRSYPLVLVLLGLAPSAAGQSDTLVSAGATWSYLDDGSDQGTAWSAPGFDDSTWAQGPAQLGYGDGDENTVVSYGPDSRDKHITTYFRHSFVIPDASIYQALTLELLRDDAAVAYLNGVELMRSNMTSGSFNSSTTALSTVSSTNEDTFYPTHDLPTMLVSGTNVLAVEIHQQDEDSSDISLDARLIGHQQPILARGPYLQKGSDSRVTLCWRTIPAEDSQVRYGAAPGSLTSVVSDPTPVIDHEVELTGLTADTTYYYAVGSASGDVAGDDADHFFLTHPLPGTEQPTRIWVLGDSGMADNSAAIVRDAYYSFTGSQHTDLWLMLGDNAYVSGSDDEYQAAVFDMYPEMLRKSVLWPTRGNHEKVPGTYYNMFAMPTAGESGGLASGSESYYSFDYANVHFICLDSYGTSTSVGGAMYNWLEADLAATSQDWILAFWHHPPYTKGSHDSDDESELIVMRENFLPLLEAGGVDLVFCGHSHSYERSFLLDGHYDSSGTLTPAMVIDGGDGRTDGDGAYNKADGSNLGTVYTVAGSSGKTSSGSLNHPAMYRSLEALGSVVIDVDGGRVDVSFLRANNVVADHWTFLSEAHAGNYCVALVTTQACYVNMSATGSPSITDPSPFVLTGPKAPNDKFGLLFYGYSPANAPLFSGRLCVGAPQTRTDVQNSEGAALACTGSFTYDFNARIQSGADAGLTAGTTVYTQYWFRDLGGGAGLSDGYQFVIGP